MSPAALYRDRGFGHRIGYGDTPAVLVVDLMHAFTDPAAQLGADLDDVVRATSDLIAAAREGRRPLLFVTTAYDFADARDAGLWRLKEEGITSLRTGSHAVGIDHRLDHRRGEDYFVTKKFASGFFGTDLASRLRALDVDTLLLAGCSTSGCVRVTAVDGLQHGFRVMIVREAVGDRDPAAHERGLLEMDAKYADVVALADAVGHLRAACPRRSERPERPDGAAGWADPPTARRPGLRPDGPLRG